MLLLLTHNVDCHICLGKHQKTFIMRVPCHCPARIGQVNHPQHLHRGRAVRQDSSGF